MTKVARRRDHSQQVAFEYDELLQRALRVPGDAPYWSCLDNTEWARIVIDGDATTLYWPEATSDWDVPKIEQQEISFPTSLLFLTDEEVAQWKKEQRAIYDAEQEKIAEADHAARIAATEAADRSTYERLKKKFESSSPPPIDERRKG